MTELFVPPPLFRTQAFWAIGPDGFLLRPRLFVAMSRIGGSPVIIDVTYSIAIMNSRNRKATSAQPNLLETAVLYSRCHI